MTKSILLLVLLFNSLLPSGAQTKNTAAQKAQPSTQMPTQPSISISKVVIHEPPRQEAWEGYWVRFTSPENLPNILLCITGIAGVVVALCTLKTIARQTKATEDSLGAIRDQTKASQESVEVARKTMILQFRPNIKIPVVSLERTKTPGKAADVLNIQVIIVNEGSADAHVIRSLLVLKVGDTVDPTHTHKSGDLSLGEFSIRPGQGIIKNLQLDDATTKSLSEELARPTQPNTRLRMNVSLGGHLWYRDDLGIERLRIISRFLNGSGASFVRAEEAEEYGT
jgi:hypothetical protein